MEYKYHTSVLVKQVLSGLDAKNAGIICDATLGDGGYSLELLKEMPEGGVVIGIDRDPQAIARAQERLDIYKNRFKAVKGNFKDIEEIVMGLGFKEVDGIVADLGVSRLQISDPSRGFMFLKSGPLLMNMGDDSNINAETIVNEYDGEELARIFWEYGEERASRKIAKAILKYRQNNRIETTEQLVNIIRSVVSARYEIKTFARIFQSLRIFINREIDNLKIFLPAAVKLLKQNGYLAIVSYHSLEDRVTKQFMREQADPCTCSKDLPRCVCGKEPTLKVIGKMITPDEDEIRLNPSSRSGKLRIAQRI